jgi:hypothetical protein
MTGVEEKLLEEGRRLKREIDEAYVDLVDQLSTLGTLKRDIIAKESALRGIQERLLASAGMPPPPAAVAAERKRMRQATDDDDFRR